MYKNIFFRVGACCSIGNSLIAAERINGKRWNDFLIQLNTNPSTILDKSNIPISLESKGAYKFLSFLELLTGYKSHLTSIDKYIKNNAYKRNHYLSMNNKYCFSINTGS